MAGPTTAALERDLVALNQRITAIERDIHELRVADRQHDQKDWEEFQHDRERISDIDKSVEEAKRIIGDLAHDVQDVEKKVSSLELSRAANKWVERLINAAVLAIGGLVGAAIFKLIGLLT